MQDLSYEDEFDLRLRENDHEVGYTFSYVWFHTSTSFYTEAKENSLVLLNFKCHGSILKLETVNVFYLQRHLTHSGNV